ncbi:acetyl-CoA c-acetyltransferase [Nitzschia inconspicua]|uniref:Acetyl-CoA c-acetyltransferase n=1 Tax=Nitzschia inconspicua TaxID=303405 RepID=A0A9K3K6F1_9STRA|nr:acetyl-CoA c-acetyltransferase [Nitzschia inconspicua]KAG7349917.1 acetyl-CoA c-acetyltransferase [Nitzschia inconspicua]
MSASPSIVIASVARTPIAKFMGSFSSLKGSELAAAAIKGALAKLPVEEITISEAIMGNVVSAGMGQAPTRQAVMFAGLAESTVCTTINKVCASGMKSVMLASQTLAYSSGGGSGGGNAILAGGFESMSNIPHYLSNSRSGTALGNATLIDGVIHDGLWDLYNDQHMGMCGEKCAKEYGITREDQDAYAMESYRRAMAALEKGVFEEVIPVEVPTKRRGGDPIIVSQDEEPTSVKLDKLPSLKPAFDRENGTVTAANASSLNDGACAIVLMTEEDAISKGIEPLARIRGFGDAEQAPVDFTTTPSLAVPVALKNAGCNLDDVDYHEINEAFSVVALANIQLLNLDPVKVNVFGGAVSLGHPIGMSGARIIGTLYDVLKQKDGSIGCASICNGGGGASAIVIERMN